MSSGLASYGTIPAAAGKKKVTAAEPPVLTTKTQERRDHFSRLKKEHHHQQRKAAESSQQHVFDVLFSSRSLVTKKTRQAHEEQQQQQQQQSEEEEEAATQQLLLSPESQQQHHRRRREKYRHSFAFNVLNSSSKSFPARLYKSFVTAIIVADIFLFVLSTDPRLEVQYDRFFHRAEGVVSTVFLVEYVVRLAVVVEKKRYRGMNPWAARLKYAATFPAVVDLLATVPFFLEFPTGLNLPTLTWLRFLRLIRILKSEGSIRALDTVYRVIYYNSEILSVAALVCLFLVLITAILLYYFRPRNHHHNPEFQSISATLYLAMLMLTGQGGPDSENLPWYTKAIVLLTAVFSVAMFAIPASMLTWGFEAEAERMAKRARKMATLSNRTESTDFASDEETDSSYDSGYSTDEEYFRIIAGEDSDDSDGEGEDSAFLKALKDGFKDADANHDGTLTLSEYIRMQTAISEQQQRPGLQPIIPGTESLAERVTTLEEQVRANSEKLDRILELLQAKKRW